MKAAVLLAGALLAAAPALAGRSDGPIARRLAGHRAILFFYVGSNRNATFSLKETRRPVTTIVDGARIKYEARYLLELPKSMTREHLAWYDSRLRDKPGLRGFEAGEVAVVDEVEEEADEVEVKIRGAGSGDERKGRILFKFKGGVPELLDALEEIWRVLLPEPPFTDKREFAAAMAAAVHRMEASRLADWMRIPPEDVTRRVAEHVLDVSGLAPAEREAVLDCYQESYLSLSDRFGIALTDLAIERERGGRTLRARVHPHQALLGDWRSDAERAGAAFEHVTARAVTALLRSCTGAEPSAYRIVAEYDFGDRDGWGTDRLVTVVPASVAADYAGLQISTRELAARAEHRLNDLPLFLAERR